MADEREEIKELKAKYCRYIDTKLWSKLPDLFVETTRFEGFGSAPTGASVTDFVRGVSGRLQDAISVHHCHTPEIVFLSSNHARAVWAMEDYVEWPLGTEIREVPGHSGFKGYGHYEEEYRKLDGAWRISFMRLTRLRIDPLQAGRPTPAFGALSASLDWV